MDQRQETIRDRANVKSLFGKGAGVRAQPGAHGVVGDQCIQPRDESGVFAGRDHKAGFRAGDGACRQVFCRYGRNNRTSRAQAAQDLRRRREDAGFRFDQSCEDIGGR
jgi:hypothetical protein